MHNLGHYSGARPAKPRGTVSLRLVVLLVRLGLTTVVRQDDSTDKEEVTGLLPTLNGLVTL